MSLPTLYEYYTAGGINAGLSADNSYFTLNNKNITIYSGALHYFRVPEEYWRDRLKKLRAAGLNTVETYTPWNLHEPEPGFFDFGDGGTDWSSFLQLEKFLQMAQEEDLFAIVRPGPYICSEWEWGGMPSWLLREKGIEVRSSDALFMGYANRYLTALLSLLTVFQFTLGGPIIAFQIENEFGTLHRNDTVYKEGLKSIFTSNGIVELLVTSDGPVYGNYGQIPGVLYTANFNKAPTEQLDLMQTYQPGKPSMVMEYWTGWFDHWGEEHNTVTVEHFTELLEEILDYPSSVNFYMFHGGTSYAFMNGGNLISITSDNLGFEPDTSSYDYDAPLNEQGNYTDKYFSLKAVIAARNQVQVVTPELPAPIPTTIYEPITAVAYLSVDEMIAQTDIGFESENVLAMELFPINNNAGQRSGYAVYRKTNLNIPAGTILKIGGRVRDAVTVLVNGELINKPFEQHSDLNGFGYWRKADSEIEIVNEYQDATLDLIVENFGRNNFGLTLKQFDQYKGLWDGNVTLNGEVLLDWTIYPFEFKKNWLNNLQWSEIEIGTNPSTGLFMAALYIDGTPMDTFVDMRGWNRGFVAVNGFVVSRHFRVGPQQAAYIPAPFLHEGQNLIVIFEHFKPSDNFQVVFSDKQIYETLA